MRLAERERKWVCDGEGMKKKGIDSEADREKERESIC